LSRTSDIAKIVKNGNFSKIQHLLYTSAIIINLGIALAFGVILTLIIVIVSILHWIMPPLASPHSLLKTNWQVNMNLELPKDLTMKISVAFWREKGLLKDKLHAQIVAGGDGAKHAAPQLGSICSGFIDKVREKVGFIMKGGRKCQNFVIHLQ
jgi:hypothetical protein